MTEKQQEESKIDRSNLLTKLSKIAPNRTDRFFYSSLALQHDLNHHYNDRLKDLEEIAFNYKLEYTVLYLGDDILEDEIKVIEQLDDYGSEGWELVTVSESIAFFKRRSLC